MNKSMLVELLIELNNGDPCEAAESFEDMFKDHIDSVIEKLSLNPEEIPKIPILGSYVVENTYEWKYICLNFFILNLINKELNKAEGEILSVQETKKVKACLRNLLIIGVLKNLQINLPHSVQIYYHNPTNIIYNYEVSKATINSFIDCINLSNLRLLILPNCLQGILVGVLQLGYAPLKKPPPIIGGNPFKLTEDLYDKFEIDQQYYRNVFVDLRRKIHYSIFIVELMQLFRNNTPYWFKKAISKLLTNTLKLDDGIERITTSLFDCCDDTTKNWHTLEILSKLIVSCRKFSDFQTNICRQLNKSLDNNQEMIFERLYVQCTKTLFNEDVVLCKTIFVSRILLKFRNFVDENYKFLDNQDLTDDIRQTVRLIYNTFLMDPPCLPVNLLKSVINVIFQFCILTNNKTNFQQIHNELREVLVKYLENEQNDDLFDNFLFNVCIEDLPQFRHDIIVEIDEKIIVNNCDYHVIPSFTANIQYFYQLLTIEQKIRLFGYLLRCLTNKDKYFLRRTTVDDLLNIEEKPINSTLENLIEIHKLLAQLADDGNVQKSLKQTPDDIIHYLSSTLNDNDDTDTIFITIMILENLLENSLTQNNLIKYKVLLQPISKIIDKTTNRELRISSEKIRKILIDEKFDLPNVNRNNADEKTEFDKALEDLCDPLLPVRGHALMILSKLVEQKNQQAMERQQYLLNLFQMSLKNGDSYIYLNAVQGLAALADIFPDTILEVLCEEYSTFNKKTSDDDDALETRMKLGEVLVRVIKLLGEMAPKYKALLLNTFLIGTKDDDHLMRASSLSNLGEVCRVLGYKLGTIVTEVLVCIHAIIATDRAVEARRAAVTVIRQLFVGLESEMITYLKDDILPIYRTLKEIHCNDKDDVMRLQAQLALEELNENMKNFVFPKPQLNIEKEVVMLK